VGDARWLLLIHQLPQRPLYLRARVKRELDRAGAVALKNSVYALPRSVDAGRLPGIAAEVTRSGGEAFVCEADFLGPESEAALVASFRRVRASDYEKVGSGLEAAAAAFRRDVLSFGSLRLRVARARRRLVRIQQIDFFAAPGRTEAEAALAQCERLLEAGRGEGRDRRGKLRGRTWVTRRGVQVDRIASAWLIRRFVDPRARFRFVNPHADEVRPDEIRFDMAGGEFTHEEDRCTFETLVRRCEVRDAAVGRIAQIVHDIDIKDGKFGRPEARGVEQLLHGLLAATADDRARLERGFALFDDLHRSFSRAGR
jgi:hypothetical protein